ILSGGVAPPVFLARVWTRYSSRRTRITFLDRRSGCRFCSDRSMAREWRPSGQNRCSPKDNRFINPMNRCLPELNTHLEATSEHETYVNSRIRTGKSAVVLSDRPQDDWP